MSEHVNGWSIIEQWLQREHRNQSWRARALHVTPAAITQVKKAQYHLSAEQFNSICHALHATKSEKSALYTAVVNARFFVKAEVTVK